MGGPMSQEEIDALLNSSSDSGKPAGSPSAPARDPAGKTEGGAPPFPAESKAVKFPDETDLGVLGEVYNISMGAAATAVSSLLRIKVDITTPTVTVIEDCSSAYRSLEPALGVEIKYISGINGSNIFVLSQADVMKIVDILLGGTGQIDPSAPFDEMHESAIGEVMNQMMGSASTALAGFLNTLIDISIPRTFKIDGDLSLDAALLSPETPVVSASFKLTVGDIINSEMIITSTVGFANDVIDKAKAAFGITTSAPKIVETTINEAPPAPKPAPEPKPSAPPPPVSEPEREVPPPQSGQQSFTPEQMSAMMQMLLGNMQQTEPGAAPSPKENMKIQPVAFGSFDKKNYTPGESYKSNMDLLLEVPLEVTVEIGRTRQLMQDVLDLGEGSVIELDKQSAEPVDVYVNGQLVAKGSVVVIEENFGVRITEIISPQNRLKLPRGAAAQ